MSWSDVETETILRAMRAGAKVKDGVSRCYTEYYFEDGSWISNYCEMTWGETKVIDEDRMRRLIERKPEIFRGILRSAVWVDFVAAYRAGDVAAAHRHLDRVVPYQSKMDERAIPAYRALMNWPDEEPSEEMRAYLRGEILGFTAYHLFMGATGWDKSVENNRRGVDFVNQLEEMVGTPQGFYRLRASFLEDCLRWDDALNDMEKELERTPDDDEWKRLYRDDLKRMAARIKERQGELDKEP